VIGIVAFSFGMRDEPLEPNPCNVRLGNAVIRILDRVLVERGDNVCLVAQWEIARSLRQADLKFEPLIEVPLNVDGSYLDSEGVWEKAVQEFRQREVTAVIPVCHRFLQMTKVKGLVKANPEFRLITDYEKLIGDIGFDPESNQPWTRSKSALLRYAVKQKLTGAHGD